MMSNGSILVVDDEVLFLRIIRDTLEDEGFDVVTAENGRQALDLLMADPGKFDVVVIDRFMPVLDGMELLRIIRDEAELFPIPVVMQTAAASSQQIREGIEAGAFYYITKPYDQDTLVAIVKSAVQSRQQSRTMFSYLAPLDGLCLLQDATFHLRTLDEGKSVAWLVGQNAEFSAEVMLGLMELITNGIEHGNLGIGGEEKEQLLREGRWEAEIRRRLELAENADKVVIVRFEKSGAVARVAIDDRGPGFDWEQFEGQAMDLHNKVNGRGITMARSMAFDAVEYMNGGNRVVATFAAI